jgi:DegV family protein with EDD domain
MKSDYQKAFINGVERIAAWSDLLDHINVFPVADGDTGRNLIISLTPLREIGVDRERLIKRLLLSARGNSGNIAVQFLTGFLTADGPEELPHAAKQGRDYAWRSINDPKAGTMLTVFDALAEALENNRFECSSAWVERLIDQLEKAVHSTPELLPRLQQAGVIDAGALGMYIYLESFFKALLNQHNNFRSIVDIFKGKLKVSPNFKESSRDIYCVDTVVRAGARLDETVRQLADQDEDVIAIPHQDYVKIHLHTDNKTKTREMLESFGSVVEWSDDHIGDQIERFAGQERQTGVHIMTDAAGSVTRDDAQKLGITLLDSYISMGEKSLPETFLTPSELYTAMRRGIKVSTSQASVFERHQYYQSVLHQYEKAIYICVGSYYTGNYETALAWKQKYDPKDRLTVIDSGTASGRLGAIVIAAAKFAAQSDDTDAIVQYVQRLRQQCEEYVFLDKLKYLAAGGRLSKTKAFFGDILNKKPVISPNAEGAVKVGLVPNKEEQIDFAIEKLSRALSPRSKPFIMLEYSDNYEWIESVVTPKIRNRYAKADILLQPMSLTSGAHMGPGTWAVAFIPDKD